MTLPGDIRDREHQKFKEVNSRVTVSNSLEFSPWEYVPAESLPYYKKVRSGGQQVTYIGENKVQNELETTSTWRVSRIIVNGYDTITEYADNANFSQQFNNPSSLFPNPPYVDEYSLNFSSGGKNITIPNAVNLNFGRLSPWTISFWGLSQNTSNYTWFDKTLSGVGYKIEKRGGKIEINFRGTGGASDRIYIRSNQVISQLTSGSWFNIIISYSGSGIASGFKVYVNGVEIIMDIVTDGLATDPINAGPLVIGSNSGGGNYYFAGLLDEICLWNEVFTIQNVGGLYNSGVPIDPRIDVDGYTLSGSLISFWPFTSIDRANLPTIRDNQDSNHGTSSNVVVGNFFTEIAP